MDTTQHGLLLDMLQDALFKAQDNAHIEIDGITREGDTIFFETENGTRWALSLECED